MKKTISILMIAMMLLTSGALSAYALGEETMPDESPVAAEAVADVAEDTAAAVEDAAAPEEAVADIEEPVEAVEEEIVEIAEEDADFAGSLRVTAESTDNYKAFVSWNSVSSAATYTVFVDDKAVANNLTSTSYTITGMTPGSHTIKVSAVDGTTTVEAETTVNVKGIANVSRVSVYGGYASVSVYWPEVAGAEKYVVVYSTKKENVDFNNWSAYHLVVNKNLSIDPADRTKGGLSTVKNYAVKGITRANKPFKAIKLRINNTGTTTYFKVYAVKTVGGEPVISAASPIDWSARIEYIKYKFTLKKNKKLSSHDGKNKTYTFKKGQTLTASGFGGGKFKFYYTINGKEYYFYCTAIDTKNCSSIYKSSGNYSVTAAENYVNEKGFRSPTKYLIWTSLYCQHTYVFTGSKGNWTCVRHFEVGSGAARAASPSGEDKELIAGPGTEKNPGKKYSRKGHGRRYYWNPYSAWNSYHSVRMNAKGQPTQTLGYPASKGCIRCSLDSAKYIYGLPRHTKVVVL